MGTVFSKSVNTIEKKEQLLYACCREGNLPTFRTIMEYFPDTLLPQTYVSIVVKGRHLGLLKLLIDKYHVDTTGLLVIASDIGDLPLVKYLVEENIGQIEEALHLAIAHNHYKVAKYLLGPRARADPWITSVDGVLPINALHQILPLDNRKKLRGMLMESMVLHKMEHPREGEVPWREKVMRHLDKMGAIYDPLDPKFEQRLQHQMRVTQSMAFKEKGMEVSRHVLSPSCANWECGSKPTKKLKKCGLCKDHPGDKVTAYYCSKKCQIEHWESSHRAYHNRTNLFTIIR